MSFAIPHDIFFHDDKQNIVASVIKFSPLFDTERLEKLVVTVYASHTGTVNIYGKNSNKSEETLRLIDTFGYSATDLMDFEITQSMKFIQIQFLNDGTNTTTHEVTYRGVPYKQTLAQRVIM